jgi:uncharacterized integral membrane protein (TIGR00698 family)
MHYFRTFVNSARTSFPGLIIVLVIALSAMYLAELYGAPVMLFALLLGMALNFLGEQKNCCTGINFATKTLLRMGVALLGLRITFTQVQSLGMTNLLVIAGAVVMTICTGIFLAQRLGRSREFGLLTGGSVGICGASAALAIAAVLPQSAEREKQVVFTVLVVTTLSTIAMIAYPIIATQLALDSKAAGLFLGGTIHDVAQVVGAGYGVSTATGDFATITKLFRVLLLIPVFLTLVWVYRDAQGMAGAMQLPWFILGFAACMLLASFNALPQALTDLGLALSKLLLVMAIAALGMKSNPRILFRGSLPALTLVLTETLLLGGLILTWLLLQR